MHRALSLPWVVVLLGGCNVTAVLGSGSDSVATIASGKPGVWENVTPQSMNLDPNANAAGNYGVLDVLADPVRPSDLYAFACYQGVWKSTDYGLSWAQVNTVTNAAVLDSGRPFASIDPNPARDPATPPALFATNMYGTESGVLKSTDGGVNWSHYALPGADQDVCFVAVDPGDGQHVLASYHDQAGLLESIDGGQTWTLLNAPAAIGVCVYPFFVDTGTAGRRTTWLTEATWADVGGSNGVWRTTDSGASWTRVESFEHALAAAGMAQPKNESFVYAGGAFGTKGTGVYQSSNGGANWTLVASGSGSVVFASSRFLYAAASGPSQGMIDPAFLRAPLSPGTAWSTLATPPEMTNGPSNANVTNDGSHDVIVSANWLAGIWRYVEP
jgi:hypothetical protein